jgi:prepilin-type N-terminal cleavage/methylation domain-containing protein
MKNQGFTILEVMIAMGITAMIMVALMQVTTQAPQSAKSSGMDTDFSIMTSNVQMLLTNDCTAVMQGQKFSTSSPYPIYSLAIPSASPSYFIEINEPQVGVQVKNFGFSPAPSPIQSVGNYVEYQGNLQLIGQKVIPPGQPILPGTQTFIKNYQVMFWSSDHATISRCQQATAISSPVPTIVPAGGCTTFNVSWGGSPTPSNGVLAAWLVQVVPAVVPMPMYSLPTTPGSATPLGLTVGDTYEVMFTDLDGNQTFGTASPSPSVLACP